MTKQQTEQTVLKVPSRNTSLAAAVFNVTKAAVGVGTLFLPFNFKMLGLVPGLLMLVFASLTSSSTLYFLGRIAANTDLGDYMALGRMAYGNLGEISAMIAVALNLIGALICYADVAGTYLGYFLMYVFKVDETAWFVNGAMLKIIVAFLIFPLACLKDLSKLAKASIVGMFCMMYVCLLAVADYFFDSKVSALAEVTLVRFQLSDFINSFSNLLFAFVNHFTLVAMVPVMFNPTPARRYKLLLGQGAFVLVIYVLTGLFGYLHFGNAVNGNILLARDTTTLPYAIAQLLVTVVLIVSFPLLCGPTKAAFDQMLTMAIGKSKAGMAAARNIILTASIVGVCTLIAITCQKIVMPILNTASAFSGSLLVFVFPSLYFLRLSSKYQVNRLERGIAYFDIVLGLVVMVLGTFMGVRDMLIKFSLLKP